MTATENTDSTWDEDDESDDWEPDYEQMAQDRYGDRVEVSMQRRGVW